MNVQFPVEATQIAFFARAIGDQATDVAPPTFAVASAQFDPDYQLRPNADEPWFGSSATPSGRDIEGANGLHAEQHFDYVRPIVAGDVLEVSEREGSNWEKRSRGGGILRFNERIAEYRDARTGSLVVTARSVWVLPDAARTAPGPGDDEA